MLLFHPSRKRRAASVAALLLLLIGGYGAWRTAPSVLSGLFAKPNNSTNHKARAVQIPVTVETVQRTDFPVYLNGLGTVQPYDTVTIRSRVDGQIIKVGFEQGQMVKEGDLLVQIDPRPFEAALEQAKAKKAQDEANLANAQLDLKRFSALAEKNFASRQQLDTQQATVKQLTAQIKGDQATIDNATTQLSYTTIRSPLSGKAGFRLIDPGNIVHASDPTGIVSIVKLQPISVVFTAPEENVGRINAALAAGRVPVTALSSDGRRTLAQGHLALVNNTVDQASGTIKMKATFENKDNALWPGLSVMTQLLIDTQKNVVAVSNDAIQHGPNGLYVFVVGPGNKVEMRNVQVGNEGSSDTVVENGVTAGERVVVAGQYRLVPGALVAPNAGKAPAKSPREAANTRQRTR